MSTQPSYQGNRFPCFLYGSAAYVFFLFTFLYAAGFVGNVLVPKSVDSGEVGPMERAISINVLLLSIFAIQHAIMARPWFKARWTRIIPVSQLLPAWERPCWPATSRY